jgi:predicted signal transduction protein with EAL and GGDEF domain
VSTQRFWRVPAEKPVKPVGVIALGLLVAFALAVLVWELPSAWRFLSQAPPDFWVVAALALLVDAPLFIDQRNNIRTRPTLSIAICFAIFLLWGVGPAVVVQVLAGAVTAIGQRYDPIGGVFLIARLVVAFGATRLVMIFVGPDIMFTTGTTATPTAIRSVVELGAVWFVAAHGALLFVGAAITGRGLGRQLWYMRDDLLTTVASVFATTPLFILLPRWWNMVAVIPVFAANLALRERIRDELVLRRDPVTGLQGRRGLLAYIDTITLQDGVRVRPYGVAVVHGAQSLLELTSGLGRDIYDLVVIQLARQVRTAFEDSQVGRLSGEGFVLVAPELATDPVGVAARAVRAMNVPMEVNGIPFRLHVSAGVALSPEHGRDLDTLLGRAELAVAEANRQVKTVVVYAPDTATTKQNRVALLTELNAALRDPDRRGEISLLYQPQVHVDTGRFYGAEALIRWTHPEWGPVPPDQFIEAAELSEVMHLLTRRVIEIATDQMRAWNDRGFQVRTSVNASAENLVEERFAEEIDAALRARGIPPDQLTIEITERTITTGSARIARAAERIANLGVGLSVDDFGTGFASLQQLRVLPLREVKIDRSYVCGVLESGSERAIVTSVHQLARALGLHVVAEGVEDANIAQALAELPGTVGQGWHFGRPMAADDLYDQWHQSTEQQS